MRLMQVQGTASGRQVVATDDGESWFVEGYRHGLRPCAGRDPQEDDARQAGRARPAARRGGSGGAARRRAACCRRSTIPTPPISSSPAPASPISARRRRATPCTRRSTERRRGDADRLDEDVPDGPRRRQAEAGQDRRPAGVVLQGRRHRSSRRRARRSSRRLSPRTAARSPRSPASMSSAKDGMPWRVGFALLNEFSDHVTERQNYLWLAHSKLRPCSFGPELLLGDLPDDVRGTSRIRRGKTVIFEQPFLTGEANMSHSIANLEAHHFKYPLVPPAGRCPCPHLRHGDALGRRRHQDQGWRRLRDRGPGVRPAAGQSACGRRRPRRSRSSRSEPAIRTHPTRTNVMTETAPQLHRRRMGRRRGGAQHQPVEHRRDRRPLCPRHAGDAEAAIAAAKAAFPAWSRSGIQQRHDILKAASDEILARREEIGRLLSREEGKTLADGIGETVRAGQIFDFFAGEALRLTGEIVPSVRPGIDVTMTREPVGVVGIITPWNFPIAIPAWKIAPALAYGNTVVFKPADLVPGSAWAIVDILVRAGLPKGVLNLVMGAARSSARRSSTRPTSTRITFTGSIDTGTQGRGGLGRAHAQVPARDGRQEPARRPRRRRPQGRRRVRRQWRAISRPASAAPPRRALIVTDGIHDKFVGGADRAHQGRWSSTTR